MSKEKVKKKCKICGEEFEAKSVQNTICSKDHKFTCPICGEEYICNNPYTKRTCGKVECKNALRKLTNIDKYGVDNVFKSEEIKSKIKSTNKERYGVECSLQRKDIHEKGVKAAQSKEVKEKRKKTNLEKYGTEYGLGNKEVWEKIKETNKEKYGVEYIGKSEEIRKKMAQTNLERYGSESALSSKEIREKIEATNLERYGVNTILKLPEIQEKAKQASLEKYGVEYAFQSEEVRKRLKETFQLNRVEISKQVVKSRLKKFGVNTANQAMNILKDESKLKEYSEEQIKNMRSLVEKYKKTLLEKYGEGVYHPTQSKEVMDKIIQTNKEKYGGLLAGSPEIKERIKQSNLKKYGVDNPWKSEEIKEKIKKTSIEKYGVEHPSQSLEIQEKIKKTNIEKYGVEHGFQSKDVKEKIKDTYLKKYGAPSFAQRNITNLDDWINLDSYLKNNHKKFDCMDLSEYFNVPHSTVRKKVRETGLEASILNFTNYSQPELEFKHFFDSLGFVEHEDYIAHNRKLISPLEVDFYFPKYGLAVEISPTWTHNADFLEDPHYHYNKFKLCQEKGIELITIFDWQNKESIFRFLENKLSKNHKSVFARKLSVSTGVMNKDIRAFLKENHILGSVNGSKGTHTVELKDVDNKLVGVGVFEEKENYIELRRLAFLNGYSIPGGASKIIKYFLRNNGSEKPLVTFSDNNLGSGSVYGKIGFKKVSENRGSLLWYNGEVHFSNLSLVRQGADRLLKRVPGYMPVGMGEDLPSNQEIVQQYGFMPI